MRLGYRVLIMTNSFVMGGMERHIADLACRLVARGMRVDIIYSKSSQENIQPMLDSLQKGGVTIHGLPERRGLSGWARRFKDLYSLTRRISPDVIHIHSTGSQRGELALLAFKIAGPVRCRIVRTDHTPPDGPPSIMDVARLRIRDLLLDQIIVVSNQNRTMHLQVLGRSPKKVLTIHNGIDPHACTSRSRNDVRAAWSLPPGALVVGMVARLDEYRKGADVFLRSIAFARVSCPQLHFVVIGDGKMRAEIEQYAAQLELAESGRFLGHRTDVVNQLVGMDVFVLPSRYEGLPYTLLEALRSGKPIVATRVGGVEEVLADNAYGMIVPTDDPDACAAALIHLANDAELRERLAAKGPQRIAEQFSIDSMVDKVLHAYGLATKLDFGQSG